MTRSVLCCHLVLLGIVSAAGAIYALTFQLRLSPGPGADLVAAKCQSCHSLQMLIDSAGISADLWKLTLPEMESLGLELKAEEKEQILDYLVTYPGTEEAHPGASPSPARKTDTAGETLYQRHCSACHWPGGEGVEGAFPPLAGNPELFRGRNDPLFCPPFRFGGQNQSRGPKLRPGHVSVRSSSGRRDSKTLNFLVGKWGGQKDGADVFKPFTAAAKVSTARKQRLTIEQILLMRNRLSAAPRT